MCPPDVLSIGRSVSVPGVIVLLPPSETKRAGGDGPPLRLEDLGFPELGPLRAALVDELIELAADSPACRRALGHLASQDAEIERNAALREAPTMPAITATPACCTTRWTSDRCAAPRPRRARAGWRSARRCSGYCAPTTPCPPTGCPRRRSYRANRPWLRAGGRCWTRCWRRWRRTSWSSTCGRVRTRRSAGCQTLSRGSARRTRRRQAHRGQSLQQGAQGSVARALATTRSEADDAAAVATVARRAGLRVERRGNQLTVVVPA